MLTLSKKINTEKRRTRRRFQSKGSPHTACLARHLTEMMSLKEEKATKCWSWKPTWSPRVRAGAPKVWRERVQARVLGPGLPGPGGITSVQGTQFPEPRVPGGELGCSVTLGRVLSSASCHVSEMPVTEERSGHFAEQPRHISAPPDHADLLLGNLKISSGSQAVTSRQRLRCVGSARAVPLLRFQRALMKEQGGPCPRKWPSGASSSSDPEPHARTGLLPALHAGASSLVYKLTAFFLFTQPFSLLS